MPYFMGRKEKWETWGAEMAPREQQAQSSGGLRLGNRGTDIMTTCQSLKAVSPNQNASTAREGWFLNCPEIEVFWWGEGRECHCMFTEAYSTAAQALSSEGHKNLSLAKQRHS